MFLFFLTYNILSCAWLSIWVYFPFLCSSSCKPKTWSGVCVPLLHPIVIYWDNISNHSVSPFLVLFTAQPNNNVYFLKTNTNNLANKDNLYSALACLSFQFFVLSVYSLTYHILFITFARTHCKTKDFCAQMDRMLKFVFFI